MVARPSCSLVPSGDPTRPSPGLGDLSLAHLKPAPVPILASRLQLLTQTPKALPDLASVLLSPASSPGGQFGLPFTSWTVRSLPALLCLGCPSAHLYWPECYSSFHARLSCTHLRKIFPLDALCGLDPSLLCLIPSPPLRLGDARSQDRILIILMPLMVSGWDLLSTVQWTDFL